MKMIIHSHPELIINSINRECHSQDNFLEQIAVLYPVYPLTDGEVTFIRTWIEVCQSGSASFDPDNPGADTAVAWERMDGFLDDGAAGFFHTHPLGMSDWSYQDRRAQHGIAKSTGERFVFHGVQPAGSDESRFVCCWMQNHRVFRYDCGLIPDFLGNLVIRLKLPPFSVHWENGAYNIACSRNGGDHFKDQCDE